MAMEPTTEHKLEDISGKDLPKDLAVRHQNLLHCLDAHGFEEPPEAYDPKYLRMIFSMTCSWR